MRYLGLGCRGEARGDVVIWWKICWNKFLRSFREILACRKGRGQAGGGYYGKVSGKVSRKPCSLNQYSLKQHYALGLMFAQFRKQQLQSYSFHSRDRPRPLMSRCGEIRKKNISKLWILVMMTNVGGGLPGGGDGILHGFEFLNIWMVRYEKGVRVRNGLLNRSAYPVSPSQRWREWNGWEMVEKYFAHIPPSVLRARKRRIMVSELISLLHIP